jgi:3-methyl-2-oxobutanoate hydroxymethyltransferase
MSILNFYKSKQEERKLSMVTCYDAAFARVIAQTQVDSILVGDSVAMVVHGHDSTLAADTDLMALHVAAVKRGLGSQAKQLLVGDMPFLSYRGGIYEALKSVDKLMKAGAHAVKLEGVWGHEDVVEHIVKSGVPVQGHIGLTPQSLHQLGGFRVQGKSEEQKIDLIKQAKKLEELGCFSVVLECVPSELAKQITLSIQIPTIGIGAGPYCDGQVLVLHDLLGLNGHFRPKFLKTFLEGEKNVIEALNRFDVEVKNSIFPSEKESYT